MQIIQLAQNKIKVLMNVEELMVYELTYEKLSYNNEPTRRLISNVVSKARALSEFEHKSGKLLVEVFAKGQEALVINITSLNEENKTVLKPFFRCFVFEFNDFEDLMNSIYHLSQNGIKHIKMSELVHCDNVFQLQVHFFIGKKLHQPAIIEPLFEFSSKVIELCGKIAKSSGDIIIPKNAISVLKDNFPIQNLK